MSLKRHGKTNKPNSIAEHPRLPPDYPSREELIAQLSQLRSSLDGAYETLDSLAPSADPEIIHKVADMVDIINGLHECEFELMDLLAKDSHVISPAPSRGGDNPIDNDDERLCDGTETGEHDAHSRVASQEDLSLYGAYAVSSSRAHKTANEMSRPEKSSDQLDLSEKQVHIPAHERADYIKRLEEIQKVNERLVDRCRRLGLVLRCGFALDKNFTSKIKEVKDIIAAKDQAQRKLKTLMAQVTGVKVETTAPLTKFENDETYGKPFPRFEPRGASSLSPDEHVHGPVDDENIIKKPRSYLGFVESTDASSAPDYAQFLRGLSQPYAREHGERESAFVPIHNASHLDSLRDKNKRPTNVEGHGDHNNDVKHLAVGAGVSLRRMREMDDSHSSSQEDGQTPSQWDQQRLGRSSSARSALAPPPPSSQNAQQSSLLQRVLSAANNNNTLPNNLYRGTTGKSPISLQSSSGMGSMNSRSLASIDNCRNDLMMSCNISRAATRNQDTEDNIGQRGFSERSNNLNKPFRQPTRSSSFYSELDFRNQEFLRWDDDRVNTTPCPSPPFRDLGFSRRLSTTESQQITDELNRVRRYRNVEETLPQQNWWGSGTDLGHSERQSVLQDHHNFMQRGKSALNEKQPIGTSYYDLDALLYDPIPNVNGQRNTSDCYTQNMQLSISIQELSQQIRNLNAAVSANKAATRDALMQQRFDLHNMTRNIRDVSDMISESTKRIVTQISSQTRIIVDIEARLRRLEDNQRVGSQKPSTPRERERDWQVPGRPDVMLSQEMPFQFGVRDPSRDAENGTSNSMLNNQIPPGTRANNYWDNFRSYSRQNMLSKSNANVHQTTYSHEPSPSAAAETSRYSAEGLNHTQLYSDISPGSLDTGRRNGGVKNSWATSGFYENMSSKKRNKDQKSQSTFTPLSKVGSSTQANCTVPESLHTSHARDAHPEPDENNSTPTNRQQLHSGLSPRISPFRRDPEPRRYSHFTDLDLHWPPVSSEVTRKANFERDMSTTLIRGTDAHSSRDMLHHRDVRLEENNPNSQSSASKVEREKHIIQKYEHRPIESFMSLDDTRSTNQEVLDTADDNTMPDWATSASRRDESSNTHEGPSSTAEYRSPLSSPLLRHIPDNIVNEDTDQTDRTNEVRGAVSPPNITSNTDVPLNIRCEESSITENSLGRSTNRSDTSGSNNL
ncbi:unnamed protein product [Orchesella dallaii]|uniref:Uncharacterized protein n=1 Tax=Orchesella dallaii TaxID=48710 RepID=A0ABP1PXG4_9HEXA